MLNKKYCCEEQIKPIFENIDEFDFYKPLEEFYKDLKSVYNKSKYKNMLETITDDEKTQKKTIQLN